MTRRELIATPPTTVPSAKNGGGSTVCVALHVHGGRTASRRLTGHDRARWPHAHELERERPAWRRRLDACSAVLTDERLSDRRCDRDAAVADVELERAHEL